MLLTTSAIGASAILEPTGEYTPDADVETNRYYFYMPEEWCNEYTDTAGVYWWDGTDACGGIDGSGENVTWPGYKAKASEEDNLFYVDCPKDVERIIWNNYVDGGTDIEDDMFLKAVQSVDVGCQFYSEGDSDLYNELEDGNFFANMEKSLLGDKSALGEYADNFFIEDYDGFGISFTMDNMIYIIDPTNYNENPLSGRLSYVGEWYFYYGNGEYGTHPVKADAEAHGTVGKLGDDNSGEYNPPEGVETNRYYFYMPDEWYNEYTDTAGVYWWDGTDACGGIDGLGKDVKWPGYKAKASEEDNIFYVDCPKDVPIILWNNYVDGGEDTEEYIYLKSEQTVDIMVEYYSEGDSELYDENGDGNFFAYMEESFCGDKSALGEYADNFFIEEDNGYGISFTFDNMIYVIDPDWSYSSVYCGKVINEGEWYFYYGNGEYGTYPLKEDAEKYGIVGKLGVDNSDNSDNSVEYNPPEGVETNRYNFYMPQDWCNEYTDTAGVYWWDGTDACGSIGGIGEDIWWPGYKAKASEEDNIFYVDCPTDVPMFVWNNHLNGGEDMYDEMYQKAEQTDTVHSEFYAYGDSDVYPMEFFEYIEKSFYGDKSALGEYADNFFIDQEYDLGMSFTMDNMIYVIDPDLTEVSEFTGKNIYVGDWYFYYGNREYGNYPLKSDAEKYGIVGTLELYDPNAPVEPKPIEPKPTEPTTEPSTPPVTIPEGESFIYFDVKESGWSNVKNVFCHIWRPDGTAESHAWQSKKEKCVYDPDTGIAYYDLSKLNFPVTAEDGREFCVIFSANTGAQTYNTIMSGSCIGDTMYCIKDTLENPEDSEKKALVAVWRNNPDCGPEKKITSTGNIVGTAYAEGVTDETLLADFLINYYLDPQKTAYTEQLVKELNVSPVDVMAEVRKKVGSNDPDGKVEAIEKILAPLVDPTKPFECDVNGDGVTNIMDATSIQKFAVEIEAFTASQLRIADVNKDGVVNVMDATMVQKSLAGII